MSDSNDEVQQCFIPASWQQSPICAYRQSEGPQLSINRLLGQAKDLHNRSRPTVMHPRTCFLELPLQQLPPQLMQYTGEHEEPEQAGGDWRGLDNGAGLGFGEYFRNGYELVYNKMSMYQKPGFHYAEPTSRFKPISYLTDFHDRLFKQLQTEDDKKSPLHVLINDRFDSCFQSGNLGMVFKKTEFNDRQYFLLLENDINTHGYSSWFFFKVTSCGKGRAYFHILNMSKSPYLYRMGWRIATFSQRKHEQTGLGWHRAGANIQSYTSNFYKRGKQRGLYHTLYFEYEFEDSESEVYFAMNVPYTYTQMVQSVMAVEQSSDIRICKQVIKSIYSISCNIVPVVVVSKCRDSAERVQIEGVSFAKNHRVLVFMARQHPGQVIGSNLMQQLLAITQANSSQHLTQLLQNYTLILIPMLNPDGVIHGNSRCNLAGLDLNRQWMGECLRELTPETYLMRKFLWQLHEKIGIEYLVDLHGHSKKMNSFFFCNKDSDSYSSDYIPYIVSKIDRRFDISSCTFNTTSDKKNTLRNQLYELGMKNCLTVENSYFGYWSNKQARPYCKTDCREMIESILASLHFILCEEDKDLSRFGGLLGLSKEDIAGEIRASREQQTKKSGKTQPVSNDIESESDPDGEILRPEEMAKIYDCGQMLQAKKVIMKSKKKIKMRDAPKESKQMRDKRLYTTIYKEDAQDEVRKTEPRRQMDKTAVDFKNHQSQKKLQFIETRKSFMPRKMESTPKPSPVFSRKYSQKRQGIVKTTVLNIEEKPAADNDTHKQKQNPNYIAISNNVSYEACLNKTNKQRRMQTRMRTDVLDPGGIKRYPSKIASSYTKVRDQRLKMFLNETLSIIKVNNHEMHLSSHSDKNQLERKSSAKTKVSEARAPRERIKTQEPCIENDSLLQIENYSRLSQERKKIFSKNYRKELIKRKKILSIQEQSKNYKRFESFVESKDKEEGKDLLKLECNSVFYYFPVL